MCDYILNNGLWDKFTEHIQAGMGENGDSLKAAFCSARHHFKTIGDLNRDNIIKSLNVRPDLVKLWDLVDNFVGEVCFIEDKAGIKPDEIDTIFMDGMPRRLPTSRRQRFSNYYADEEVKALMNMKNYRSGLYDDMFVHDSSLYDNSISTGALKVVSLPDKANGHQELVDEGGEKVGVGTGSRLGCPLAADEEAPVEPSLEPPNRALGVNPEPSILSSSDSSDDDDSSDSNDEITEASGEIIQNDLLNGDLDCKIWNYIPSSSASLLNKYILEQETSCEPDKKMPPI